MKRPIAFILATTLFASNGVSTLAAEQPPTIWNLKDLYSTPEIWDAERTAILGEIPKIASLKGTLGADAISLANALDSISAIRKRLYRLGCYSSLKADEDTRISENNARRQLHSNAKRTLGFSDH